MFPDSFFEVNWLTVMNRHLITISFSKTYLFQDLVFDLDFESVSKMEITKQINI